MAYRVEISPLAEADLESVYRYIANDSPTNALRWWRRFYEAANRLALFPEAYPVAPESSALDFEVRQKLYGNYRILFSIEDDRVLVLHVRHAARLPATPEELLE